MEEQRKDQEKIGSISIFGGHMERPDVQKKVMSLIEQRNYLDSQCYVLLQAVQFDLHFRQDEAVALVRTRIEANDDLMKLIAGDLSILEDK